MDLKRQKYFILKKRHFLAIFSGKKDNFLAIFEKNVVNFLAIFGYLKGNYPSGFRQIGFHRAVVLHTDDTFVTSQTFPVVPFLFRFSSSIQVGRCLDVFELFLHGERD